MHNKRYRWLLILTAVVLIVMLGGTIWSRPKPLETVKITQAAEEKIYNSISVKGTVRAARESQEYVYAPARVEKCYVSLGDSVRTGQALLQVSYPEAMKQAEQAVSAFFDAAVHVSADQAKDKGIIVRASMDGTVAQIPSVGDMLIPGMTAVRIGDFSRLEIEAKIPELYAGDLEVGQRANITPIVDRARTVSAELTEIAPYAVQTFSLTNSTQSAVVRCSLKVTNPSANLMPGTTVDVKLFTDTVPNAVTVPYAAIRQDGEQQYVLLCREDGTVKRQDIQTGYQLSRGVQIRHGVQAGEWVVNDSSIMLQDGQKVKFDADR